MLGQADFDFLRGLVRERAAIVLEPGTEHLVESRLLPLVRDRQRESIAALVDRLRLAPRGELEREVIQAMTTNETSFFRDRHPFDALRTQILPGLIASRAPERRLRFWSNACSSGQEAWSLAMLLAEHFPVLRDWEIGILATDLSREMVQRTQAATYGSLEVNRGLPAPLLTRFFERDGTRWRVKPELRRWVQARELNLAEPWPSLPRFDVILLRNVLLYVDVEAKRTILRRARQALRPDGCLLLGSAETTLMLDRDWERLVVGATVAYRPVASAARAAGSVA